MPDPDLLDRFIDRLGRFDGAGAAELASGALATEGVTGMVLRLLVGAQHEVGRRWEFGEWTVAQEHAATAIVDDVIGRLRSELPVVANGPHVALVCAEGEWHVTPARLAGTLLTELGWRVTLLGGSTPAPHLARTLDHLHPDVLAVSCTLPLNLPGARRIVGVAHDLGIPVVAGGGAIDGHPDRADAIGADAGGQSLLELEPVMRSWLDRPTRLRQGTQHHQDEVTVMRRDRPADVEAAFTRLLTTSPGLEEAGKEQLDRTREDLDYMLQFLDVALDVGDRSIFTDFLGWLVGLLAVRGVPPAAVDGGLAALEQTLDPSLTAAHSLLERGRATLSASPRREDPQ